MPRTVSRSIASMFHAATDGVRIALRQAYRAFVDGFRHAADVLRRGLAKPKFPPGSFPPGLPSCRTNRPPAEQGNAASDVRRATGSVG